MTLYISISSLQTSARPETMHSLRIPSAPGALSKPSQAGFGLVEVMIAMAIGMIGILAMMQAFAVNERYKENTVGSSGAQTNGSIALFTIERDVRMAGYGITNSGALGCSTIQYHYDGAYSDPPGGGAGAPLPTLIMAPVVITQGSGTNPDSLATMSSSNAYRFAPATITSTMPHSSAELNIDDVTGFAENDLVVATQGSSCALMQVTQVQGAALKLQHNPGVSAPYNPAGGGNLLPAFGQGAQLFNLGNPQIRFYAVSSNNLTVGEWSLMLAGGTPTVLVDEIVDLQAEYGVDDGSNGGTAGDGSVDGYTVATPATAAGWAQVLAIRLAVLARGPYDKPDTSGTCTATTVAPTWAGGNLNIPGGVPSCYRYRVFETLVPIRNMIWRDA